MFALLHIHIATHIPSWYVRNCNSSAEVHNYMVKCMWVIANLLGLS